MGEAPGASKVEKAKKLSVPILTPEELVARLGNMTVATATEERKNEKTEEKGETNRPQPPPKPDATPAAKHKPTQTDPQQPELF